MNTRSDIARIPLATICIATSVFFGGLMLADSVERGPQSLGQLPVNVHSVQAHGMTVPGTVRITTAQMTD